MMTMQEQVNDFLDKLLIEIHSAGIDIDGLKIDHIAFSTKTTEEYEKLLPQFLKNGKMIQEAIISNRRVGIVQLSKAILYKNDSIGVVDLLNRLVAKMLFLGGNMQSS